jgi:hypothetical protein
MADDRVVAVGLLTAADVALLGQGFRRLFPVPRNGDFADLLHALDRVELIEETDVNMAKAQDEPSEVAATDGRVLVDGPGGLAVTFTPRAARETGRRLGEASDEAERQPVVDPDDSGTS